MLKYNCLVIGYGSSGQRYCKILQKYFAKKNIFVLTKNTKCNFKKIKKIEDLINTSIDIIIISSETYKHYEQLKFIEKNLKDKIILVEKPLFYKNKKIRINRNKVFVAYNLRFDPMIQFLKKKIEGKNIIFANFNCFSHLPGWRKNISYTDSYSSSKTKGGGVTNDLSHEIDLAYYLTGLKKIKFATNSKISNLKINSDDFSLLLGHGKNLSKIVINLNYFFQKEVRQIFIKTSKESFFIDIVNRNLTITDRNGEKKIKFKKNKIKSYEDMIKNIIYKKNKICCTYNEGLKILEFINN